MTDEAVKILNINNNNILQSTFDNSNNLFQSANKRCILTACTVGWKLQLPVKPYPMCHGGVMFFAGLCLIRGQKEVGGVRKS